MNKKIISSILFCPLLLPAFLCGKVLLFNSGGNVYKSEVADSTWKLVEKGFEIKTNTKIKTDPQAQAIIQINKNISLYLRNDTMVQMKRMDQKVRIELLQGVIQVNTLDYLDDFIVTSLFQDLKIDSKNCLIKSLNNILLISVFDHNVILMGKDKGFVVSEGNGISVSPGQKSNEQFPLPVPPVIEYPENKSIITPGIDLKWSPISEAMLYRIEIAQDKDFVKIVKAEEINSSTYSLEGLAEGTYYWRVSSLNRKNMEGLFLDSNIFNLQKGYAGLVIQKKDETNKKGATVSSNEDLMREALPGENTKNSIILGSMILLSIIILIIL